MLSYWFLLVPKVDLHDVVITNGLPDETYILGGDGEFGPLELNRPMKFIVKVKSGIIPVKSVAIIMPTHGKSNALALTPTGNNGEYQLNNYPLRPIHAIAEQPAEELRDFWLIIRNNWGIQNEIHLKVIVVAESEFHRTAMLLVK